MKKDSYHRTFKRKVINSSILYAGMAYTAPELSDLEGCEVEITKFGAEPGSFDISKLLVNTIPFDKNKIFWIF